MPLVCDECGKTIAITIPCICGECMKKEVIE